MPPEILLWVGVVECAGFAVLPLASHIFRRLPDRGYALAKSLGLLLPAYLIWLLGMLGYLEYRRVTVLVVLALLAVVCWYTWGGDCWDYLRRNARPVASQEGLFLGVLALGMFVRAYNPDIIGQEKFMDLAFFNGFLATTDLPAEDTWLAGYAMPYYPFGYFLLSAPAKLAGLPPAYGYNMAMVLVFALTFVLSSSLAASVVALLRAPSTEAARLDRAAWGFGLLSGLFVAICGNLVGPLELLAARGLGGPEFWGAVGVKNLQAAPNPDGWLPREGGWWWHASRVIPTIRPDGITEFPYFSFLLGDLHPHYIALPLLILILGLVLALLLEGAARRELVFVGVSAMALGALIVANTWDIGSAWLLFGLAALAAAWRSRRRLAARSWAPFVWALAPIPLSVVLYLPYFVGYASQRLGLALVRGQNPPEQTPLVPLLLIFGPLLLIAALLGGRLLVAASGDPRREWPILVVGAMLVIVSLVIRAPAAGLAFALLTLLLVAGQRWVGVWLEAEGGPDRAAICFLLALAGVATTIIATVEFVYLRDSFGTRMNTVFKLYYNVWLLLGQLSGPALALLIVGSCSVLPTRTGRTAAGSLLFAGLALGLVYPLAATWTKSNGFRGVATLDGAAFLARTRPADAAAIRWLAGRPGRPIVMEAVGGDYQEFARISTFSGLPTVIGWVGHELQWRGQLDEYNRRQQDVERIYRGAEPDEGLRILQRYGVSYVYVGSLERERYGRESEERLARWLTPVFRRDGATVFAVPGREGDRS